jgi:hypothetical protein
MSTLVDAFVVAAGRIAVRTNDAVIGEDRCPTFQRSDFRWRWAATNLHTFVFVIQLSAAIDRSAPALAEQARQWARRNKGGMPHGVQTGSVAMPILIVPGVRELRAWAEAPQRLRFASGLFPIVVSSDGREAAYRTRQQKVGVMYESFLRNVARGLLLDAGVGMAA